METSVGFSRNIGWTDHGGRKFDSNELNRSWKGRGRLTPPLEERKSCCPFFKPFRQEPPYFFLQVHLSDGWLQPTHTPFLIAMPQVLHGSHPQVWHMETSLIPLVLIRLRFVPGVRPERRIEPGTFRPPSGSFRRSRGPPSSDRPWFSPRPSGLLRTCRSPSSLNFASSEPIRFLALSSLSIWSLYFSLYSDRDVSAFAFTFSISASNSLRRGSNFFRYSSNIPSPLPSESYNSLFRKEITSSAQVRCPGLQRGFDPVPVEGPASTV